MIKIVHMTSVHPPFDARIFKKHCLSAVERDIEVCLVAPSQKDELVKGVRIISVPSNRRRLLRMLFTTWQVFFRALRERADIYQFHDPELLFHAQLLRLLNRTVIYDMHENLPKAILSKSWIPASFRKVVAFLVGFFERCLMYKLPVIFAEMSYAKDYSFVNEAETVLNFPRVEQLLEISTSQKFSKPTLCYLGRVSPERGVLDTAKALCLLQKQGQEVAFKCLGPIQDSYREELDVYRRQMKLDIEVTGALPQEEAWKEVAKCHMGISVLQPLANYYESYPTKMFEYMALKLPVIVSDFPLYKTIMEKHPCGLVVKPSSPELLAQKILYFLTHPQNALQMGEIGRKAVEDEYNWASQAKKLLDFYKRLTPHKKSAWAVNA